eukprot:SAG31_NODE_30_length_32545_cov_9.378999_9_plen_49_part_00
MVDGGYPPRADKPHHLLGVAKVVPPHSAVALTIRQTPHLSAVADSTAG